MDSFVCVPHGNPVRPSEPFSEDQCRACWVAAGGNRYATVEKAVRPLPCIHEQEIQSWCPRGDESLHLRGCGVYDQCTRQKCRGCGDYTSGKRRIEFHLSCNGIGDAVVGFYAACGAANAGYEVVYYAKQEPWLRPFSHPGVAVVPWRVDTAIDANADYGGQLRQGAYGGGVSRARWYCDRIAASAGIPEFVPARPKDRTFSPVIDQGYALFGAFSHGVNREWSYDRWRDLAHRVHESGKRVVAIGTANDRDKLGSVFGGTPVVWYWGYDPAWTLAAIANADRFYGLDSGLTHVAGLLGIPATAVVAQLPPEFLFDCSPTVACETPEGWGCSPCGFQYDRGYRSNCDGRCDALQSIGTDRVLSRAPA